MILTNIFLRCPVKKIVYSIIVLSLLGGCSTISHDSNKNSQSVPEEMPASKYVGQGFQPKAEKSAIEYAKKHRKAYEKLGEQFFKDNFSLNVKTTNVVGSGDGVEVYVHCDDHDIVFNASIPFDKESIHEKGSMRSHDNGDDMSNMVGTVLSGFEYRAQKEKYDNLTRFYKNNKSKYDYIGYTQEAINKTQDAGYQNEYYYIVGDITSLKNYRKYYEPLIKKSDVEFKNDMREAYKNTNYKAKREVITTLFSTLKTPSRKKCIKSVYDMSKKIEKEPNMPTHTTIINQLGENKIFTATPKFHHTKFVEFGAFDDE
ncbi:DUF1672 domain-containing protein [Staphylococcus caprae]|nr:DUF1672 domain-containing protein [Staphylococcus caprae]MBN6826472.1 DUF1672 domain-containing protein [Staphylococcus caprae]MBX5323331.1 DUF1672 domain-containing protein [Staphylococcus caprae]QDW92907.1 DUF1672 domain-containing protein [Staphylococcus caprae]